MRKLFIIGFSLFVLAGFSQSQVCDSTAYAQEGTYHIGKKQIAVESTSSSKEVLTGEMLCLIEQKRHQTDTITAIIDVYEIVIYPKQQKKK